MTAMAVGTLAGCSKDSSSGSQADVSTNAGTDTSSSSNTNVEANTSDISDTVDASSGAEEGKVINIYSWNNEFRERVELVYPEVKETSSDGTVTTLNDGTEIHWIINPNHGWCLSAEA